MKASFKKTRTILLLIAGLSLTLVGCGTGADNSGMGAQSSIVSIMK